MKSDNILFFDLETTGLPSTQGFGKFYPYTETQKYDTSRIVSFAFFLSAREAERIISDCCHIVYPI